MRETEERLVDPIVVRNLEDKMNELTVEKTHWQKKAQSLSKDMLRYDYHYTSSHGVVSVWGLSTFLILLYSGFWPPSQSWMN